MAPSALMKKMQLRNDGKDESHTVTEGPKKTSMKKGYINKQRVLVFCSRGISTRNRHFMEDLRKLLPHHKKDVKFDAKATLHVVNEIAEIKGCNNTLFLESRKKQDLYMWLSRTPAGPSAKFLVQNVHTMDELKLTGNSLRGSRPLLTFDSSFEDQVHLQLLKQIFITVWGTPKGHPKSKPFIDRVMSFYYADGKIWCRNFQIADEVTSKKIEASATHRGEELVDLIEIGPRFVLTPIRIFDGSFGGQTIYSNPKYVSPNDVSVVFSVCTLVDLVI